MIIKIGVAGHKPVEIPQIPFHTLVCAGADKNFNSNWDKLGFKYEKDNDGENISKKNSSYCELTVLYWIWKHWDADYIGLSHYRRYFNFSTNANRNPRISCINIDNSSFNKYAWDEQSIINCVSGYDVILQRKERADSPTCKTIDVSVTNNMNNPDFILKSIADYSPEYEADAIEFFSQNEMHWCNMMIMKKEYFNSYCEWMFGLLDYCETQARALGMNEFRLYGYISEYLLNIWVIHQEKEKHIRVKSLQTVFWTNADKTHSFKQLSKLYVKQAFNIVFPYSSPIREKIKWMYLRKKFAK